jgi:hypothetical protein
MSYHHRMTKKARIAAAISAPVLGSLAAVGFAMAPAAPAGAASPITITSHSIVVDLEPLLLLTINF